MESPQATPNSTEKLEATNESTGLKAVARLSLRLWTFGGPWGKLTDLPWKEDIRLVELIGSVLREHDGLITERQESAMTAAFADPLHALAAAKNTPAAAPQPSMQVAQPAGRFSHAGSRSGKRSQRV
jgi:hypothetical protein